MPINVVVVEDEPIVLKELAAGLEEDPMIKVCGQAQEIDEAFEMICRLQPDALFLDIQLDGGTAFDLLRRLRHSHSTLMPVVLNTGFERFEYAQTALNEFGDQIVHILQKPFFSKWETKRQLCLDKILTYQEGKATVSLLNDLGKFVIRSQDRSFFIDFDDIEFLEVAGNGSTYVKAREREPLSISKGLVQLLRELPAYIFRISRFEAVNLNHINSIDHENHKLYLKGVTRPFIIGTTYYPELLKLLR